MRDLTRYRVDLIGDRGREKNRVEKLLEDAGIKLSLVASDLFGISGRAMMDALIAGERDPQILAQLARTRLRAKIPELQEALTGHFTDHHGFLLTQMLRHVDDLDARITAVEAQIDNHIRPYADTVARLDQIPGIGPAAAGMILAEIGTDMTRFPTAAHLASWAKFSPTVKPRSTDRLVPSVAVSASEHEKSLAVRENRSSSGNDSTERKGHLVGATLSYPGPHFGGLR